MFTRTRLQDMLDLRTRKQAAHEREADIPNLRGAFSSPRVQWSVGEQVLSECTRPSNDNRLS